MQYINSVFKYVDDKLKKLRKVIGLNVQYNSIESEHCGGSRVSMAFQGHCAFNQKKNCSFYGGFSLVFACIIDFPER